MFPGLSCYLPEIWLGNTAKRHFQTQSLPWLPGTDLWPSGISARGRGARRWQQRGGCGLRSIILIHITYAKAFHEAISLTPGWSPGIPAWLIPQSNTSFLPPVKRGGACDFVHCLARHPSMRKGTQSMQYEWWLICQVHKPSILSLAPSYVRTTTEEGK